MRMRQSGEALLLRSPQYVYGDERKTPATAHNTPITRLFVEVMPYATPTEQRFRLKKKTFPKPKTKAGGACVRYFYNFSTHGRRASTVVDFPRAAVGIATARKIQSPRVYIVLYIYYVLCAKALISVI